MKPLLTVLVLAAVCAGVFALGSIRQGADDKPFLNVADDLPITVKVCAWLVMAIASIASPLTSPAASASVTAWPNASVTVSASNSIVPLFP